MKRILSVISFIFCAFICEAQYPVQQNLGAASTLVKNPNYGGFQGGLIPYTFSDTTSANTALTFLKTYNGALIYTTGDSALYFRSNGATKWVQILPSGGTTGLNAWLVGGNTPLLTDANGNATFGANQNSGIIFRTNSLTRLILDKGGIVRSSGAANKYLTIDTITKQMYYGDAASVSNEWHITGNSGTSAGTNFLGTNDNVGLMFKVNGGQAGYIETTSGNVSLGAGSLVSNISGTGISAFGDNSLHYNTSGVNNTALGQASLYHTINATYNTAVGLSSMQENTSGGSNTSIGAESLYGDTSGTNNTAVGRKSLYQVTSGSANIGLGYFSGANSGNLSNRLFINSINRTNISGDTTKSIIYGYQDATASNQRLYANSQFFIPYAVSQNNGADSMMVILPSTGKVGYRAIPSSSTPTLQQVFNTETGGAVLTKNDTIDAASHSLTISGASSLLLKSVSRSYIESYFSGAAYSNIDLQPGSFDMQQSNGSYSINNVVSVSDTSVWKPLVVDSSGSGYIRRLNKWPSGGGSLFPLTGTGTATGNVTGDLASNTLSIMNGNVGIGTATPSEKLEIIGNIKADTVKDAGGDVRRLTSTQIAFGDGSNLMTSSSDLTFSSGNLTLNGAGGSATFYAGDLSRVNTGFQYLLDAGNNKAWYDNTAHTCNLGINTVEPSVALDVVGDVKTGGVGTRAGFMSDIANYRTYMGDYSVTGNGVHLRVDDDAQNFIFDIGQVKMTVYGAGAATFDASGNITSVSDERLKTNIKPYKTGLKELLLINPIQYNWNEKSKMETKGTYAGFSAQNVKANIPYGTGENKDGYLSLQDRSLLATAFNAIKELSAKVDKLESQNKQLLKQLGSTGKPKKIKLKF